jgi:hypothetical protein
MDIERPKADTQSLTILKARLIKRLSIGIAVVNLFGAGTLLAVVPAKHQGLAGAGLLGLGVLGYLYKIEGAESIIRERIHKGGIILPEGMAGPHEEDAKAIVRLSKEELERLEKVRDFIQTGRELQKSFTPKTSQSSIPATVPKSSIPSQNPPPVAQPPTTQPSAAQPSATQPSATQSASPQLSTSSNSPSSPPMKTLSLDQLAQELGIPVPSSSTPGHFALNQGPSMTPQPLAAMASLRAIAQETLPVPSRAQPFSTSNPQPTHLTLQALALEEMGRDGHGLLPGLRPIGDHRSSSPPIGNGAQPAQVASLAEMAMEQAMPKSGGQPHLMVKAAAIANGSPSPGSTSRPETLSLQLLAQSNGNDIARNLTVLPHNSNGHENGRSSPLRTTLLALQQEILDAV